MGAQERRDQAAVDVGVDGSEAALGATRWATRWAVATGVGVHLVHAIPQLDWFSPTALVTNPRDLDEQLRAAGEGKLDEAQTVVRKASAAVPVQRSIIHAPVAQAFADVSQTAGLIVLGAHWSGRASDVVLGGQIIRVIARATCPVLAWRPDPRAAAVGPRPIVVGVDDSDNAHRALEAAFGYADTLRVPLTVAHAWSMTAAVGVGYTAAFVDWEALRRGTAQWLADLIAPYRGRYPDVPVDMVCTDGTPARILTRLSDTAQMVIVGTRGRSQLAGTVLGSVSQNLIHHATSSVLIIP